jgi:hypothetical protein
MYTDAQLLAVELTAAALAVVDDAVRQRLVTGAHDAEVGARLTLHPVQSVVLRCAGIAEHVLLHEQPYTLLDLIKSSLLRQIADVHSLHAGGRPADVVAPRELSGLGATALVECTPHIIDARINVHGRAVLRVSGAGAAHVSPRVGSSLLVPPLHLRNALRARPHGQLAVVRRTVKVLLHVVGLRDVHGRDRGRARLVGLAALQLAHLAQVGLVLVANAVAPAYAIRGWLLGLLAPPRTRPLHRASQPGGRRPVHILLGRRLPHALAVHRVGIVHGRLARPRVPHAPVYVALHELRLLLEQGRSPPHLSRSRLFQSGP